MYQGVNIEKNRSAKEIAKKIHPNLKLEIREYFFYFLKIFLFVAVIFTFIRTNVFYPTNIDGVSMQPNLNQSDLVYIDLFTPKFGDYKRGEIVIVKPPGIFEKTGDIYIKRVIGLPGEKIGIIDGKVQIFSDNYPDGIILEEGYIPNDTKTFPTNNSINGNQISNKLLENEYFVIGDNRSNSTDSRSFGAVNKKEIIGKGFFLNSKQFQDKFIELPKYNINN
jgi:signal peptidase I